MSYQEENRRAREAAGLPPDPPARHHESLEERVDHLGRRVDHLSDNVRSMDAEVDQLSADVAGLQPQQGARLVAIVVSAAGKPEIASSQGGPLVASVTIADTEEVQFDVVEEDAAGYAAQGNPPSWSASGVTITNMSADGLHAVASGPPGTGKVTVTLAGAGPADPSGAATDLVGEFDVEVTAGPVTQLAVSPTTQTKGSSTLPPAQPQ